MNVKKKLVNLDAMIQRADFAVIANESHSAQRIDTISVRDFLPESPLLPNLRKPDFQRETNHWTPNQVASLIQCFVEGELIPSVILWFSTAYVFVIDGGHRLSALRAWVEDDYGDGPVSSLFFGRQITEAQRDIAEETRQLVKKTVGSWQHRQALNKQPDLSPEDRVRISGAMTIVIPVQVVIGNADKAENSFFRINTQGTPLDDIEELLIKNRLKPIPIAARSIIRAGMGHKYWSRFLSAKQEIIEKMAHDLYLILFDPELDKPIKTLDLPLGGVSGVRVALELLIGFILVANRNQHGRPLEVKDQPDDTNGDETIQVLKKSLTLAQRMTGNDHGSLGLHPAVYFYGPSGRHSTPLFMGVATLIARKLVNNDAEFFKRFTNCRERLEQILIEHKSLFASVVLQTRSNKRHEKIADLLDYMINKISEGQFPTEQEIVDKAGVSGKVIVGEGEKTSHKFSEETKSESFLKSALRTALRCSICGGYLNPSKSVSYDHIVPVRAGGDGSPNNCQLTHPYCNQSIKQ